MSEYLLYTSHVAGVTGLQKIGRTLMNKKVQLHKHRHVPVSTVDGI